MIEENIKISSFLFNSNEKIKISFYSFEETLLYTNIYLISMNISDVKEDFINNCLEENKFKISYVTKDSYKNKFAFYSEDKNKSEELKDNKKIQEYIFISFEQGKKIESIDTNTNLEFKTFKIYVKYKIIYDDISNDMEEYLQEKNFLIGRPIINEYKYYLYDKKEEKFKKIRYKREQRKKLNIRTFLGIDSYCNAINTLYIYEGNSDFNNVKENNENSNFIKIDLISNNISIISSKFPNRILHSMIFIPKSYIFILGGKKLKNALVYRIQENNENNENYEVYPYQLPYEILEPSLIYINNKYLYAFENSSLDFHILRIDLIEASPFEEIKIKNNKYDINQKFFGVIRNNNSIIFYGGQMLDLFNNKSNKCFNYNYNDDIVERCDIEFKPFEFLEKVFIPIQNGSYFQIAVYKDENKYNPKIVIFNVNSNNKNLHA